MPGPITPFSSPSALCTHSSVLMCAHTPPWLIQAHYVLHVASVSAGGRRLTASLFLFFPLVANMSLRCKVILTFVSKLFFPLSYAVCATSFQAQVGHVDSLCADVCGICLPSENTRKIHAYTSPLLCRPITGHILSLICFVILPPVSLFRSHTLFSYMPTISWQYLCSVYQPDVMHELAHCMLGPEELSEAVQWSLLVRRLTNVERVL